MRSKRLPAFPPLRLAAIAAFLAGFSGAALAQVENCAIQTVNLCDGCVRPRRVTVQKDGICVFRNTISTQIFGVTVTVRPQHGTYGRSNQTLQAYMPKKGYVGPDYLEYVIEYEQFGKRARTTIQNQITVSAAGL